jgi:hypothetical protein
VQSIILSVGGVPMPTFHLTRLLKGSYSVS